MVLSDLGMAALARTAGVGPYFTIGPLTSRAEWQPLSTLVSDPVILSERAGRTRSALARSAGIPAEQVEVRVAASIMFLGLASQLVSPQLGAVVIAGVLPQLAIDDLWWRPVEAGPWPLAARPAGATAIGQLATSRQFDDAAARLSEQVAGLTAPLAASFGTVFRLSEQVLRGNVASALAGAAAVLASAFPERAGLAAQLTGRLIGLSPLRGTGNLVRPGPGQPGTCFRRRSCCLYYRIPGGRICGDCVLTHPVAGERR
ncbi:MAG TPA: (2Fe-2S)-binding protein [Streptosporangiaceae bacterium]|nr:(2Fe-2S)-binding protein [Streptosporangiaceae bacterium]